MWKEREENQDSLDRKSDFIFKRPRESPRVLIIWNHMLTV